MKSTIKREPAKPIAFPCLICAREHHIVVLASSNVDGVVVFADPEIRMWPVGHLSDGLEDGEGRGWWEAGWLPFDGSITLSNND